MADDRQWTVPSSTAEPLRPRPGLCSTRRAQVVVPPAAWLAVWCLCAVVALAPLVFGSVQTRIIAFWVVLLAISAFLTVWTQLERRDILLAISFVLIGACWLFVIIVQMAPPTSLLTPFVYPMWHESSELRGAPLSGRISAVRDLPLASVGPQLANGLALFNALLLGRIRRFADLLLLTFAWSGLLYALYGMASLLIDPEHVLWVEKFAYVHVLTATFVNANTASVYFGSCAVVWLLLFFKSLKLQNFARRTILLALFGQPRRQTLICVVAFFVVLSAIFMTGSRLGTTVSLVALSGVALSYHRNLFRSWRVSLMATGGVAAAALILVAVLGGSVNTRFDAGGLSDGGRSEAYKSTLRIIYDNPLFGTGLGSFQWIFPQYRSSSISIGGVWDRAHSTPLELAAEMGVPFCTAIILVWLCLMARLAGGIIRRHRARIFPVAGFWIALLSTLHSILDFSLQISGFALIVAVICGVGLAQASGQQPLKNDPAF